MTTTYVYTIFTAGTTLFMVFSIMIILFIIQHKRKVSMHIQETLDLKHKLSKELLLAQIEAQEQSYQFFSEDVHDNIGQVLTIAQINLFQSVDEIESGETRERVHNASKIIGTAMEDLRTISHRLSNQYLLKEGLKFALEQELSYLKGLKNVSFTLEVKDHHQERSEADRQKELLIFRIIQESIANSLKHAKPRHLSVQLNYLDEGLEAIVRDDGRGFDFSEKKLSAGSGIGLLNMQKRAELLNSDLLIQSQIDAGTTIHLIPKSMYEHRSN